jgi:hypothetical protein
VALLPLPASGDPAEAIGAAARVEDEGAWVMDGFNAGWCGERERVTFAQAFHLAASRMIRARAARGGKAAVTAVNMPDGAEEAATR